MPKFTRSRDGVERMTVRVDFRVERPLWDWLRARMPEQQALQELRDHFGINGTQEFYPAWDPEERVLHWYYSGDDEPEGCEPYIEKTQDRG